MIPNDNDYKGLYVYEAKPIQTGHGRSMYIQKPNKDWRFEYGTVVRKIKGSNWKGRVVGFYTSSFTKEGYAVESDSERGSVQIYPVTALEEVIDRNPLYPDDGGLREQVRPLAPSPLNDPEFIQSFGEFLHEKTVSLAKSLYEEDTANSDIHCNRYPSWGELTDEDRRQWCKIARNKMYGRIQD